jgi:hypothetical protein
VNSQASCTDHEILFKLYGLRENPFVGRFQQELATATLIQQLLVQVDGFDQADARLPNWAEPPNDGAFAILISGPARSGRSSAARWVAFKCAEKLETLRKAQVNAGNPPSGDLLLRYLSDYVIKDDHSLIPVKAVLNKYYQKVKKVADRTGSDFADTASAWQKASEDGNLRAADFYSNSFSSFYDASSAILGTPIFCFDNVRHYEQISTVAEIMNQNAVLIFTTSIELVTRQFNTQLERGELHGVVLTLDALSPEDVKKLIDARWEEFAPGGRSFIPDQGIQKVFGEQFPIGGVIRILGLMLIEYANDWVKAGKPAQPDEMSEELMFRCVGKAWKASG